MDNNSSIKWYNSRRVIFNNKKAPSGSGVICKRERRDKTHTIVLHRHDYLEIDILLEGNCAHTLNENSFQIFPGDFTVMYKHDFHSYHSEDPYIFFSIRIDVAQMPPFIMSLIKEMEFPLVGNLNQRETQKILAWGLAIKRLNEHPSPHCNTEIHSYLALIIIKLIEKSKHIYKSKNNNGTNYLDKALEYIEQNSENEIYLEQIAQEIHISPNYLSKIFKENTGMGITEYITRLRVAKAEQLIIETELSITEIAFLCGFGSQSSFSRAFNKYSGCSALEFKRRNKTS